MLWVSTYRPPLRRVGELETPICQNKRGLRDSLYKHSIGEPDAKGHSRIGTEQEIENNFTKRYFNKAHYNGTKPIF